MTHHSLNTMQLIAGVAQNSNGSKERKPSRFEMTTALYGEDETILAKMGKNARYNNSSGK